MVKRTLLRVICLGCAVLLAQVVPAAVCRALSDTQLDQVYAAGFDVDVDLGVNVAASQPNSVLVTSQNAAALQNFVQKGLTLAQSVATRDTASFDTTGAYMPNLQSLTVNNLNISNAALQNASTLMNIFALQGDVAVGVNINVVVNPTNSVFNVTQVNMNWGTTNFSNAFSTLSSSPNN